MSDFSVAKRLTGLVVVGGLVAASVTGIGLWSQHELSSQAEVLREFTATKSALNHLDTRESELKVDAYRAANGEDTTGDAADDVVSALEALDGASRYTLPGPIDDSIDALSASVAEFNDFITTFVGAAAAKDEAGYAAIAEKNSAVDDQIGAIHDQLDAEIKVQEAAMTAATGSARTWMLAVFAAGLTLMILLSIPLVRAILHTVRRVGVVVAALSKGDLTPRTGITSRD